ncbi:unnamed protein product [Cylicocyclus nassatus]|uniref:Uncharacterized protein n=1 Tax=Cylicocyclus nassatus TaxID=53992 RepID=A0AA36MFL9_CYLNA|nr:unnamed protein product [Cylicocyclus nassatus]
MLHKGSVSLRAFSIYALHVQPIVACWALDPMYISRSLDRLHSEACGAYISSIDIIVWKHLKRSTFRLSNLA